MKLFRAFGTECKVRCCLCGDRRSINEVWFDREGEPFVAYYCPEHVRAVGGKFTIVEGGRAS